MSWFAEDPAETPCVRNLSRYDHSFVEMTQDGLVCSPMYFDRLVQEASATRSNIIGNDQLQSFLKTPQTIAPGEIFATLIPAKRANRYQVSAFQGDPIFLMPSDASQDASRLVRMANTLPRNFDALDLSPLSPSPKESSPQDLSPYPPEELPPKERPKSAEKKSSRRDRSGRRRNPESGDRMRSDDPSSQSPVFDESRDADDEASSSKTNHSSEMREIQRKISLIAEEDAEIIHSVLHRKSFEEFGFTLNTSFGKKLLVGDVSPGSIAFLQGLSSGDHILALNHKVIEVDMEISHACYLVRDSTSIHVIFSKCCNPVLSSGPVKRLTVELKNPKEGLGMTIGRSEEGQLCIKKITTNGATHKDARLKIGDQIVRIGDIFVDGLSTEEVGKLLKNSGKVVRVEVLHPKPGAANIATVTLKRNDKLGLGLGVAIYTSKLGETSTIIRNILPGSPADRSSKVKVGDEVICINDRYTSKLTSAEILQVLKDSTIRNYTFLIRKHSQKDKSLKKTDFCCVASMHCRSNFKQFSNVR